MRLLATEMARLPIGRFAPSPTGELHLGSLTTALASYCHIKSLGGQWRLRIEDTDTLRCSPLSSNQILKDLTALGLHWDGPLLYQSERTSIYNDYLSQLTALSYGCDCSRAALKDYAERHPLSTAVYPRLCLKRQLNRHQHKLRLQLPNYQIGFLDGIQGPQWQNPQTLQGDMVVRRADGIINYILAVSIDDALQGITHVMRGLDIMPMTCAQIAIMQMLGLSAVNHWYHLPLVLNPFGQKLSKQNLATPIDTSHPSDLLAQALRLLNQPSVDLDTPERMLAQAIEQWTLEPLLGQQQLI
ncbi:MAG: tRNA glutamyl-Q(34) synthetase GluQRS [Psychrobacter sp.]|nr:tRNA glutamyl-Q(34) synthetase GluQRS [Psychrobacter sp.]